MDIRRFSKAVPDFGGKVWAFQQTQCGSSVSEASLARFDAGSRSWGGDDSGVQALLLEPFFRAVLSSDVIVNASAG